MTQLVSDIRILDNLLALNLNVSLWSARRKMSQEDLGGAELPPEDLASLGSKRIADPENLKIFGTLKARAFNYLDRQGVRFMSGWAIPEEKAGEIVQELLNIRTEFQKKRKHFWLTMTKMCRHGLRSTISGAKSFVTPLWGLTMYAPVWIFAGSCTRWPRLNSTQTTPRCWKPGWRKRCRAWAAPCLMRWPSLLTIYGAGFKIGRASCRERV